MTDASGHLSQVTAHLTAGAKSAQIQAINTALQGASAGSPLKGLVAVDNDSVALGGVAIEGPGSFSVFIGSPSTAGQGLKSGGNQGVFANSAQNGTGGALDVLTSSDAQTAVNALSNAVQSLGSAQAAVGKGENNFNYAINLAQSQLTNESSAESSIRDADLASEAANLTKAQILMQAGVAALAQANAAPQAVLSLLKG
jgi:flagellin